MERADDENEASSVQLLDLPGELLAMVGMQVLRGAGVADLLALSSCCHRLRTLLFDDNHFWVEANPAWLVSGTYLVSMSKDRRVRLRGEAVQRAAALSPDGTLARSAQYAWRGREREANALVSPRVFKAHTSTVERMTWLSGDRLATASSDGSLAVWDADILQPAEQGQESADVAEESIRDGSPAVTQRWQWGGRCVGVTSVRNRMAGDTLYACNADGRLGGWHVASDTRAEVQGSTTALNAITQVDHGTAIVTGGKDRMLRVWSSELELLLTVPAHRGSVWDLQPVVGFPQCVLSTSYDRTVALWDLRTPEQPVGVFLGHRGTVNVARMTSHWHLLSAGNELVQWDMRLNGTHTQRIRGRDTPVSNACLHLHDRAHKDSILSLHVDPVRRRAYTGAFDNCLLVWHMDGSHMEAVHALNCNEKTLQPIKAHAQGFKHQGNIVAVSTSLTASLRQSYSTPACITSCGDAVLVGATDATVTLLDHHL